MAPRRQETPPATDPTAEDKPPWRGSTNGQAVTRPDGSRWVWTQSSNIFGTDTSDWVRADSPIEHTPPVGGVPSDANAATPQQGTPTDAGPSPPAAPPANMTDEQQDAWYQQQMQAAADAMSNLQGQIDAAVTDLDTAQAAMDVVAVQGSRTKLQALQRAYDAAVRRQNDYATQQGKIRDRAAKAEAAKDARTMTPEQQAEHEARMAGYQSDADARAAQIAENEANRDLTAKRIEWEQAKFKQENDPARLKADDDYKAAQTRQTDAATALNKANTAAQDIKNDIDRQYGAAQAGANLAATEEGTATAKAQRNAYELETQVHAEDLRQKQEGAGVTLHRQLAEWIAAAPDDATAAQRERDADVQWTRFQSGGSQLDWQTKLNDTAVTLTDTLAARGMLTSGRGLDPTGAISRALGNAGIQWQEPTPQLTSIPGWAKAAGINLQAPQYSIGGAPPLAAGAAGVPTPPAAPVVIDARGMTLEQMKAHAAARQQPPIGGAAQGAPPAAVVTHGGGAAPGPAYAARGGVYAVPGWARGGRYG